MPDDLKIFNLDEIGLLVDTNPLQNPPGALTKAQNCVPDPTGEAGSIRKRPGLIPFNAVAGSGIVRGGIGVPIALGSAGPFIQNPFIDIPITTAYLSTSILPSEPIGQDFDDFSWVISRGDPDNGPDVASFDPSVLDVPIVPPLPLNDPPDATTLDIGSEEPTSTLVGFTLIGNDAGDWYLTLTSDATDHIRTVVPALTNTKLLLFPTGKIRDQMTGFSTTGGASVNNLDNAPACALNNKLYYADGNYTVGSTAPPIRLYNGVSDRRIATAPFSIADLSLVVNTRLINTMIAANGVIYMATMDNGNAAIGSNAATGSVLRMDPTTGKITKLGATFAPDQIPFSLLWAYGRLWCGVASNNSSAQLYWFRDGQGDTTWTSDHTFAAGEAVVAGLEVFQGKIYAAILNRTVAGSGKLMVRDTAGVWSTADSGTNDANATHLGWRGYFDVRCWPREDSGSAAPVPTLFALRQLQTEDGAAPRVAIRRLSGGTWSTVATNTTPTETVIFASTSAYNGSTEVPVLWFVNGTDLLNTIDGPTWVDRTAQLTISSDTYVMPGLVFQT